MNFVYEDYAALRRTRSLLIRDAEKKASSGHPQTENQNLLEIERGLVNLEAELRNSTALIDRIYYLRYIGGMRAGGISVRLSINESTVYRYLRIIKKNIQNPENARK